MDRSMFLVLSLWWFTFSPLPISAVWRRNYERDTETPSLSPTHSPTHLQAIKSALAQCIRSGATTPPKHSRSDLVSGRRALLEEMKSHLKIFTYPIKSGECTKYHRWNKGYTLEWQLYSLIRESPMAVTDAAEANAFYIPAFTACWCLKAKGGCGDPNRLVAGHHAAKLMQELVADISSAFPYFNQLHGHRHLWVSAHDMGKAEPASWVNVALATNGTAMVNTADPSSWNWMYDLNGSKQPSRLPYSFNPKLDVALACNGDDSRAETALRTIHTATTTAPRKFHAFFAGVKSASVRSTMVSSFVRDDRSEHKESHSLLDETPKATSLLQLARSSFTKHNNGTLPGTVKFGHVDEKEYLEALAESKFCLSPRGSRVWSPRLIEAIWYGCVPVIIADNYHLPNSCTVDWSRIAVHIPESRAAETAQILLGVDDNWLTSARQTLLEVRGDFMWHSTAREGDAFENAMLEFYVKQFMPTTNGKKKKKKKKKKEKND